MSFNQNEVYTDPESLVIGVYEAYSLPSVRASLEKLDSEGAQQFKIEMKELMFRLSCGRDVESRASFIIAAYEKANLGSLVEKLGDDGIIFRESIDKLRPKPDTQEI